MERTDLLLSAGLRRRYVVHRFSELLRHLLSYYRTHPDSEVVRNCFFVVFPATCVLEGIAFGLSVPIYKYFGFKFSIFLSGIFFCLAYFAVWLTDNPYVFAVVYSVGVGYGSGGCLYLCFLECWKHFSPQAKGKVMGTVSACYAFGPTVWSLLFSFLCNPANEAPTIRIHVGETEYNLFSEDVASRVPWVSASFGIAFAASFALAIVLFPAPPTEEKPKSFVRSVASHLSDLQRHAGACPDLKTALRSWVFWSLTCNMFCGSIFGVFVINSYKNYGLTRYRDDHLMSSIGGFASALAAVGRVSFSVAMDYYPFKAVFGVNIVLQLIAASCITYALEVSPFLYGPCVAVAFSMFTGVFSVFIMESAHIFGPEVGAAAITLIGQSFTVASIATVGMNAVLGEKAGYDWCFHLLAILTGVSTVLTFTTPETYT